MHKLIVCITFSLLFIIPSQGQGLKGLLKKSKDSTQSTSEKSGFNRVTTSKKELSSETIADGLKEALQVGIEKGTKKLSSVDGFFRDAAIKILMPEEAKKVEQKLRSMGMGKIVDNAILSMNRAAEDASKSAATIFVNAVKQMSIKDAVGILGGGDFAATNYLKGITTASLTEAFRPVIEQSLEKVEATKYWKNLFTTYNRFSKEKVNTDLVAFVTEKAIAGIFHQVGLEEQKIRKDPVAQTTDLLKKVFS